jgi:cytoskeletal protein CcmA (bactofilin family)
MFGKKETLSPTATGVLNALGEGTTIEGNLVSTGDLRLDGTVNGNVSTEGKCVLGPTGIINGNVQAHSCDISGKIMGNLKIKDTLLLKASGSIKGDIHTSKIVVESGGEFNGACIMGNAMAMHQSAEKGGLSATA